MKRVLLTALSVLLLGSLFMVLRAGRENIGDVRIRSTSFIEDITIIQKKNGSPLWTLTADRADIQEKEDRAELKDISLFLNQQNVAVRADKGTYDLKARSFTTDSAVKAEGKNFSIHADSIDYEVKSGDMKTDGDIRVEGKGFTVEGKGMQTDSDQKVRILKDVKATFQK